MTKNPKRAFAPRKNKRALGANKSLFKRIVMNWELYLFLLPTMVFFVIFHYGPMYGLQIAFKDFKVALGYWDSPWVGLKHFYSFFNSYFFPVVMRNTFFLALYSLAAGFPIPIILALMLNEVKNQRYKKLVQTVTYAPYFISMVVMVGIIMLFLSPSTGLVNHMLGALGIEPVYFMVQANLFRHIYVWTDIWQNMGYNSVIFLAALAAVDMEQHEAAVIDGASRMQRVWHINIPAILPTIIILLIMDSGRIMDVSFERVLLMQNDLNRATSEVIATHVFQRGLVSRDYSFATAVGLFNNVINVALLLVVNFVARKVSETSLF